MDCASLINVYRILEYVERGSIYRISLSRVVGIRRVHYIEQKDCTAGLDAGVYERIPIQKLIR